jgi:PAS domain S-box-containing protein
MYLYDFAPVAYFTLTDSGLIFEANLTGATLLQMDRSKLLQCRFAQFIAPEQRGYWCRRFLRTLQLGNAQYFELSLIQGDGTTIDTQIDCLRMKSIHGKCSVHIALTNITDHKRVKKALNESALRCQLLFENSRNALMTLAPPSWRFTSANKATLQLFGATSVTELTALGAWDVSPSRQPDGRTSRDKAQEMISIAMREGSHLFEWEHQRLNGQTFASEVQLIRMELGNEVFLHTTVQDISERKKLENKIRESRQLLRKEIRESRQLMRELAKRNELLREEERKYIAREVHDELGQILTALRMDITWINLSFGEQNEKLVLKTQRMNTLLDQASRAVRNIVSNLRPAALEMGLVPAIGWLCNEFSAHTGSNCVLHTVEKHIDLDEDRSVAIFRIVQELLTNVARHAAANNVEINLTQQVGDLHVQVRDDGKGFNTETTTMNESFGLLGIRERAFALEGYVKVLSTPGQGTSVTIVVPAKPR